MRRVILLCCFVGIIASVSAINPSREYVRTPDFFSIPYAEFKLNTPDHHNINVWDYSVKENTNSKRTIILVGSDAGNMSYVIWEAKALRDRGIHVVTFDYRGFGESSEFAINHNHLFYHEFAVDLDLVIKEIRTRYPENKIGLLALSMGTYVSLLRKEHIDFLVGDGFYFDPHIVTSRIKQTKGKETLLPANAARIEKINPAVPVLIFCTTEDKITMKSDAHAFSALNQVTIIESEGDHLSSMKNFTRDEPGDVYAERIVEFLDSHKL